MSGQVLWKRADHVRLYHDALNVYRETGKMPSELATEVERLNGLLRGYYLAFTKGAAEKSSPDKAVAL